MSEALTNDPGSAADTLLSPGEIIVGKYQVLRILGSGGMGAVFEARHVAIGRRVAIKVLREEWARDAQVVERFLHEARAANDVHHRNVVEVFDFGVDQGRPFLVMEYLRGETLEAWIRDRSPVTPSAVTEVMAPVMSALSVLHARGVVHRDLKPGNILLATDDGGGMAEPKVLDFGIAKRSTGGAAITRQGTMMGTPAYMAPEQFFDASTVTAAADQYAAALIVYEAVTGRPPHAADTIAAMMTARSSKTPESLDRVRPGAVSAGFAAAVNRALEPVPGDRFPTIDSFREALVAAANTLSGAKPRPIDPMGETDPRSSNDVLIREFTSLSQNEPSRHDRRALQRAAIALVAVLAAGAGAWAIWRSVAESRHQRTVVTMGSNAFTRTTPQTPVANPQIPHDVQLTLQFTPANAVIYVDQVERGVATAVVRAPAGDHAIRVECPGYVTYASILHLDGDRTLSASLVPAIHDAAVAPPAPRNPGVRPGHTSPTLPGLDLNPDQLNGGR